MYMHMNVHSPIVVEKFYDLCNRAYRDWRIHKILFVDNPRKKELETSVAGHGLEQFSILSQESILLQIAKLHDPAVQKDRINLGIDYMVKFGGWEKSINTKLQDLQAKLKEHELKMLKIRPARNRYLSHNDLETILSGEVLGAFDDGEDDKHFKALQEFVDVVHNSVIGGPIPFSEDAGRVTTGLLWFFREEACKNQPIII